MKIFDLFSKKSPQREDQLAHVGVDHTRSTPGSGRWPYGSGDNVGTNDHSLMGNFRRLQELGWTEEEIRRELCDSDGTPMSSTEYRKMVSISSSQRRYAEDSEIYHLKFEKQWSNSAIADKVFGPGKDGRNQESLVRARLQPAYMERAEKKQAVTRAVLEDVNKFKIIDVGKGAEAALGVSRNQLKNSLKELELEGYERDSVWVQQMGMSQGNKTQIEYLAVPGTTKHDAYEALKRNEIAVLGGLKGSDEGKSILGIKDPSAVDVSRVYVRRKEMGGAEKDGTIEIRRGVADLDLGKSKYAQVRIKVTGPNGEEGYMKGMAFYSDMKGVPEGCDIVYNSNRHMDAPLFKEKGYNGDTVFKGMKSDKDNPFGTTFKMEDGKIIGQKMYIGADGQEHLSPLNIVREEGDWDNWSKTLASQFLSKQPIALVNQQLTISYNKKIDEYEEIMSLTNPAVKQKLLESFADECESSAVHLKAAAMPRQSSKVILPFTELKDNEVYAPGYENGERVVLIRYPHGGKFEMPELVVNNNVASVKRILGNAQDAIGINSHVAGILSGADFDGDSVVVIPNNDNKIKTKPPLDDLKDFEPKEEYKIPSYLSASERDKLTMKNTQLEMGKISNLITDMTIKGASDDELARAVKQSMVVIDAEKHGLDYKRSEKALQINELRKLYQQHTDDDGYGGASTLISKAKGEKDIPDRKLVYSKGQIDLQENLGNITKEEADKLRSDYDSGKKVYINTNKQINKPIKVKELDKQYGNKNLKIIKGEWTYVNPDDKSITPLGVKAEYEKSPKMIKSTKMAEADDAFELVSTSRKPVEIKYAEYANDLKSLAKKARLESRAVEKYEVNKTAREAYAEEVDSIEHKILMAVSNKPLERKAQQLSNMIYNSKVADNPAMDGDEKKKIKTQSLAQARSITGASKIDSAIQLTDKEWEAIQAHAISYSKFSTEVIPNMNEDRLKQLATPRETKGLSESQIVKIKNYTDKKVSISEIANALNLPAAKVSKYMDGISISEVNNIKSMSGSGMSIEDIAAALGVSKATVSKYIN